VSAKIIQFRLPKGRSKSRPTEKQIRDTLYNCWMEDPIWYQTEFAYRLRLVRKALKISEQQAAAASGMTVKTYRKWESAERFRNNYPGVSNFAQTFGVSLTWLICGEGQVLH
jgi:Helix-turn-helix